MSGGSNPTGTITFSLYGPNDTSCDTTAIYTQTVALSGTTATTLPGFPTVAAGTYRWGTASYAGDANNNAASSGCGAEAVVITTPNVPSTPTPAPNVPSTPTPTPNVPSTPTPTPNVPSTPTPTPTGTTEAATGTPAPPLP